MPSRCSASPSKAHFPPFLQKAPERDEFWPILAQKSPLFLRKHARALVKHPQKND
jgi:hypothetical protein